MCPWNKPEPLERIWCIWEIFYALQSNLPVRVVIPKIQMSDMKTTILLYSREGVKKAIGDIDVSRAQAREKNDQEAILNLIRCSDGGISRVNQQVCDKMRLCYIENYAAIAEVEDADANLFIRVGNLMLEFDQNDSALTYFKKALTAFSGLDDINKAVANNNIGTVYSKQGKYTQALENYNKAL